MAADGKRVAGIKWQPAAKPAFAVYTFGAHCNGNQPIGSSLRFSKVPFIQIYESLDIFIQAVVVNGTVACVISLADLRLLLILLAWANRGMAMQRTALPIRKKR